CLRLPPIRRHPPPSSCNLTGRRSPPSKLEGGVPSIPPLTGGGCLRLPPQPEAPPPPVATQSEGVPSSSNPPNQRGVPLLGGGLGPLLGRLPPKGAPPLASPLLAPPRVPLDPHLRSLSIPQPKAPISGPNTQLESPNSGPLSTGGTHLRSNPTRGNPPPVHPTPTHLYKKEGGLTLKGAWNPLKPWEILALGGLRLSGGATLSPSVEEGDFSISKGGLEKL
ncbi:hypothetical protein Taro_024557, partial [Colocasia esculenta]|nr:hypothetical protein [Colocasia esculenta]